jgi:sulfite exporter TauE/SafE
MTGSDLMIPFGLGVVSSLHCTQMCGPIVLAYSLPLEKPQAAMAAHFGYNAGRLMTYSLLGAVAGAAGGGLAALGHMAGIERTAAIVAGAAMILAAVLMAGWLPKRTLIQLGRGPSVLSRFAGQLLKSPAAGNKMALGALLGFLPCGLVYAALLKAVDAGSALGGAASMCAFGLGTAVALLAIGMFSQAITGRLGRHASTLSAISVGLLGAFLLFRGLTAPPMQPGCSSHHAL